MKQIDAKGLITIEDAERGGLQTALIDEVYNVGGKLLNFSSTVDENGHGTGLMNIFNQEMRIRALQKKWSKYPAELRREISMKHEIIRAVQSTLHSEFSSALSSEVLDIIASGRLQLNVLINTERGVPLELCDLLEFKHRADLLDLNVFVGNEAFGSAVELLPFANRIETLESSRLTWRGEVEIDGGGAVNDDGKWNNADAADSAAVAADDDYEVDQIFSDYNRVDMTGVHPSFHGFPGFVRTVKKRAGERGLRHLRAGSKKVELTPDFERLLSYTGKELKGIGVVSSVVDYVEELQERIHIQIADFDDAQDSVDEFCLYL